MSICYACKNTVNDGATRCPYCTAEISIGSGAKRAQYKTNKQQPVQTAYYADPAPATYYVDNNNTSSNDEGSVIGVIAGIAFMVVIWIYAIVPAWRWVANLFH